MPPFPLQKTEGRVCALKVSMKKKKQNKNIKKRVLTHLSARPRSKTTLKDLAKRIGVRSKDEYTELHELVDDLKLRGVLEEDERGRVGYIPEAHQAQKKKSGHLTGRLIVTRRGFGLVRPAGWEDDIIIDARLLRTAFPGDEVEVSLFARSSRRPKGDAPRGEVVRVIQRKTTRIVGEFRIRKRFAFVVPDDSRIGRDIYVDQGEARPGDKVVVELAPWEDEHFNPEGTIVEVLGPAGDARTEVLSVARSFGLPSEFPSDAEAEAARLPQGIPDAALANRLDLRDLLTFTIDPEDAKDFDDAISCEALPGGLLRLGVHIADVGYYVHEGTVLDREAYDRGTSVYLVNEVIPMLPERLSNDLCSLRPQEDRLTFSALLDVHADGKVEDYRFVRSVIRSRRRFTYEEVQKILDTGDGEHATTLKQVNELAKVLYRHRRKHGSIDFESVETKFTFDEQGLPDRILKKERLDSHRLVEECMLLANKMVARHISGMKTGGEARPFLYRVHDVPDIDRLRDLANFVRPFGFSLDVNGGVSSRELQKLLDKVKGTEVEDVINEVALRSMAKAVYSEKNIGHYGLGFRHYTHFTSPIRRYPDLVVHRLLAEYRQPVTGERISAVRAALPGIARWSSERERIAADAERTSVKVMQIEYMKRHLGDEFAGVISGVTDFGLFVELHEVFIEGLVRMRDLEDDYYLFDEKNYSLRGRTRGRVFRLGDSIRVVVMGVDPERRSLELGIVPK
jgi:ribonuclease R